MLLLTISIVLFYVEKEDFHGFVARITGTQIDDLSVVVRHVRIGHWVENAVGVLLMDLGIIQTLDEAVNVVRRPPDRFYLLEYISFARLIRQPVVHHQVVLDFKLPRREV